MKKLDDGKCALVQRLIIFLAVYLSTIQQVSIMKASLNIFVTLFIMTALSGCNSMKTLDAAAFACEQGIEKLGKKLKENSQLVHKTNLNRANSLLVAAQVQHQFAEYPGCVNKVKKAQDYLSGRQTAVFSRLAI